MVSRIADGGQIEETETDREAIELMREVLVAGIGALDANGATGRSAEAWTRADDPYWPLSFVNVCATLGLEPDVLRRELLASASD